MTTSEINRLKPYPLGAHIENDAVRFAFPSKKRDCGVLLFDRHTGKKRAKLPFTEEERIGNIYCKYVMHLDAAEITYQFYEEGQPVADRYARGFAGKTVYGKERRISDWRAVIYDGVFDWKEDKRPGLSYEESIVYLVHVRGFTKHASSKVSNRGTFAGMAEKIQYLKESGITTVELQPAYEFAEIPTAAERRALLAESNPALLSVFDDKTESVQELDMLYPPKCNYWGYKRGYYYAPKAAYAACEDAGKEFKEMVRAFHSQGMEVVMQFYFPGTVKPLEITDILRFWVLEYHVDGFHLMGENLPVEMIASDELLSDTKLWYYYFDTDRIYPKKDTVRRNLAVYTDEYMYTMRKFLKGDEGMLDKVLQQMRQLPLQMGRIHYISNYYGFTLMDMVSYDRKHNEANGEDNRDGTDFNCSWNCGEEGTSRRKKVQNFRLRQIKNALLLLTFTQSTPLIFMGDEFGNSQKGNNNPYCQDNPITWLDWNNLHKNQEIYTFWKEMVSLRKNHPILRPADEFKIMDYISCGYPDLSYHGESAWCPRMDSYSRQIGQLFCGKYAELSGEKEDSFLYLAVNMYWEQGKLAMPRLPKGMKWELQICTDAEDKSSCAVSKRLLPENDNPSVTDIKIPGRSCAVYMSVPEERFVKKTSKTYKSDASDGKGKNGPELYQDRTMF